MVVNATVQALSLTPTGIYEVLKPLVLFSIGMVVYALFVFKFYQFIAERDIIKLNLQRFNEVEFPALKQTMAIFLYGLEYLIIFPLCLLFWFVIMTVLLSMLAQGQTVHNILLASIAVVAAVRVTAYYKEDLSRDLAKMLPFALLGVFLVDISVFDIRGLFEVLVEIPKLWKVLMAYLVFVVLLEFIMRTGHGIYSFFKDIR